MSPDRYRVLFDELMAAARTWSLMLALVPDAELAEAARIVEHAREFGCFLDPTGWLEAQKTGGLERQRALIAATRAYRAALLAATRAYRAALLEAFPRDAAFLGRAPMLDPDAVYDASEDTSP